jgi:hypothetical protein
MGMMEEKTDEGEKEGQAEVKKDFARLGHSMESRG